MFFTQGPGAGVGGRAGVRHGSSDATIIVLFIIESVLGNVTVKELGFVVYVLVMLVIVKELGVVLGV